MHPIEMNHCNIKNEPFNHALTYHDNLKNFCHVLRPRNHVIDEYYVNFCDPRGNGVTCSWEVSMVYGCIETFGSACVVIECCLVKVPSFLLRVRKK
jgi:hypothetical protein